jgi:hypothetical protein
VRMGMPSWVTNSSRSPSPLMIASASPVTASSRNFPAWYCTSTTSRYLLPPTLNTTRLLPQMLALAN